MHLLTGFCVHYSVQMTIFLEVKTEKKTAQWREIIPSWWILFQKWTVVWSSTLQCLRKISGKNKIEHFLATTSGFGWDSDQFHYQWSSFCFINGTRQCPNCLYQSRNLRTGFLQPFKAVCFGPTNYSLGAVSPMSCTSWILAAVSFSLTG